MPRRAIRSAIPSLLLVAAAIFAIACGPFFPNRLLLGGDGELLWSPIADFTVEIRRLLPTRTPEFAALPPDESDEAKQTSDADQADVLAALKSMRLSDAEHRRLVDGHREARNVLHANANRVWRHRHEQAATAAPSELDTVVVPVGLPAEFAEYLRGADAYHRGDLPSARRHWEAVLALPPTERRYRSTWAAFMLGKSWLENDRASAVERFREVRLLARGGFHDSLGLASSSLGWEAQVELNRGCFETAAELYFDQLASGDATALMSLLIVADRAIRQGDDLLGRVARHETARGLLTAYILSNGGPRYAAGDELPESAAARWLRAIESTDAKGLPGADRLAWLAYQCGAFSQAERWLARASGDSGVTHWIRAKLLLRGGKVERAAAELALAVAAFPANERWPDCSPDDGYDYAASDSAPARRTLGELGVLRLSRGQYVDALDALLRANYWMDAAYVAERVLTIDELVGYVNRTWPGVRREVEDAVFVSPAWPEWSPGIDEAKYAAEVKAAEHVQAQAEELRATGETTVRIRHLLARRLARVARFVEAREYLPRTFHAALDQYTGGLRDGRNRDLAAAKRAPALWSAARAARYSGLELLGTELEPDWYAVEGQFDLRPVSDVRGRAAAGEVTESTVDERSRAGGSGVEIEKRWHYRYIAANLAWDAVALMPDQSDETAKALCEAGSWLKTKDPKAADRFYKALVRRCSSTSLGKEAARRHWFPSGE